MYNILFVCEGNTCRSPMAQVLAADILSTSGCDEKFSIDSAGLRSSDGVAPSRNAVSVMKKKGIDIAKFKSKKLDNELINKADLVLTMNTLQKNEIAGQYKSYAPKILTLLEAAKIARSFKSAIDSKVELHRRGMVNYQYDSDIGQRLKNIADLGNVETSLETTEDGQAFMSVSKSGLDNEQIFDPFGGDIKEYEKCAEILEQNIAYLISFLCDGG